jgi:Rrf2 family protein
MLTRKSTYALRALTRLARGPVAGVQLAAEIASSEGIPRRFLDTILRRLTETGLLMSTRGRRGGYALRLPPEAIRVAAVIRVVDGTLLPFACLNWAAPGRCAECPGPARCPARLALGEMANAALSVLEHMTVADLIRRIDDLDAEASALPVYNQLTPVSASATENP